MKSAAFMKMEHILPFLHISLGALLITLFVAFALVGRWCLARDKSELISGFFWQWLAAVGAILAALGASGAGLFTRQNLAMTDFMAEAIYATKWGILAFMVLNLTYISYKFMAAKRAISLSDNTCASENLVLIIHYFVPLNAILGFVGIYLGVSFREF